jgi:hypothetical protein
MDKKKVREDILAFADDDANVLIESSGNVLFTKGGIDYMFKVFTDVTGITKVNFDGKDFLYRDFLAKEIGKLTCSLLRLWKNVKR